MVDKCERNPRPDQKPFDTGALIIRTGLLGYMAKIIVYEKKEP